MGGTLASGMGWLLRFLVRPALVGMERDRGVGPSEARCWVLRE